MTTGERWKHKKRGTEYTEVAMGHVQTGTPLLDGHQVTIYRSVADPRQFYVRPPSEFSDGRFEKIADAPQFTVEQVMQQLLLFMDNMVPVLELDPEETKITVSKVNRVEAKGGKREELASVSLAEVIERAKSYIEAL